MNVLKTRGRTRADKPGDVSAGAATKGDFIDVVDG